ncbi:MAG: hypothetical protein FWF87_01335 [Synergistaceae bacterium]|nr:hypothetical protein [Synergistaceae bacterium]
MKSNGRKTAFLSALALTLLLVFGASAAKCKGKSHFQYSGNEIFYLLIRGCSILFCYSPLSLLSLY